MNAQSKNCDADRIARFLRHELPEAELSEFVQHLDGCTTCSQTLESEVVGKNWWDLAGEFLADSPYDLEPLSDHTPQPDAPSKNLMVQQVLDHLAPTDDPQRLGRIGGYEIMGVVGSGGMGVVLKAFDPTLDRCVAIKTLSPTLASSGAARKRFSREARAAAAVVHDNVIEIYGVAEADNLPYLVMPYVRGTSLQRRLDDSGPLTPTEVLRVGMQTAAGLAAAHAQGLVHRDIKPANILLSEGVERVLITDFGLARAADDASLTKTGVIAGTPQYMSPEQARGESVDQRSDLFSLGSVLYTMCTGRAPFRAETSYGVLRRITDDEPRPIREINAEIPEWLCRIVDRLMAKQPEDRYESAGDIAELLEECLAHVQQPTAVPLPSSLASPSRGSGVFSISGRWLGVITMTAAFGFFLLGMMLWQASDPPDIAGNWTGEQWGAILLESTQPGRYEGTYDGSDSRSGTVQLKWSRVERRFNGTWKEADDRTGKISIRLVEKELRGAWTTAKGAEAGPDTPRLADLLWVRPTAVIAASEPPGIQSPSGQVFPSAATQPTLEVSGIHVHLPLSAETYPRELMERNVGYDQLSIHATEITVDGKKVDKAFAVLAHDCRLDSFQETTHLGEKVWDAKFFVPRGAGSHWANNAVSQEQLDEMKSQGCLFKLDHHRDQFPSGQTRIKPLRRFEANCSSLIAYSADGRQIATANGDPALVGTVGGATRVEGNWIAKVEVLNAETGEGAGSVRLRPIEGLSHFRVTAVAFSPDGSLLAVGTSIGQVSLFNASSLKLERALDDKTARLADSATVGRLKSIPRALGSVASLSFSPDGRLLAVCGASFGDAARVQGDTRRLTLTRSVTGPGRLKLWEVNTGTLEHDLAGHSHANAACFSADGNLLASTGRWASRRTGGTGAILWDLRTGTKIRTIAVEANGGAQSLAFSPDAKLLVIGAQHFDKNGGTSVGTVSLTHVATGIMEWQRAAPGWAKPVAFLPDGKSVAVLWRQQSVQLLDSATARVMVTLRSVDFHKGGRWNDLAIVPDRQVLAIGGSDAWNRGYVEEWSLAELSSEEAGDEARREVTKLPSTDDEPQDSDPPALWQDGVEPEVQRMDSDLGAFEQRAGRPWDDGPVHNNR